MISRAIIRHLEAAKREAAEFFDAGCFELARLRWRDAAYLQRVMLGDPTRPSPEGKAQ